tara:strand:- start:178 stop:399 length:222 start_codon:yes stop_codon:yes gene_type:complete
MIRSIFDKWAGTTHGLIVNMLLFVTALFLPTGPLLYCMWAWGFSMILIYWYGVSLGWLKENIDAEIDRQDEGK